MTGTSRRDLERYVLPRFGSYRIGRLPADEIENWLNDEVVAGLAASSVHRHYRTLRRMLQVAVEKQKIPANPCDRVQPPRVPERDMAFLSWDQVVALAEAHPERYRALIYLAVDSGMRARTVPWNADEHSDCDVDRPAARTLVQVRGPDCQPRHPTGLDRPRRLSLDQGRSGLRQSREVVPDGYSEG